MTPSHLSTPAFGQPASHQPVEVNIWIEEAEDLTPRPRIAPPTESLASAESAANVPVTVNAWFEERRELAVRSPQTHVDETLTCTNIWVEEQEHIGIANSSESPASGEDSPEK